MIYGLIGVLVLVPFIGNHLITERARRSVAYIVSLNGYSLLAGGPDPQPDDRAADDRGVRRRPALGPARLARGLARRSGINRWRTFWKIGVRTARPALVAGTVLATARAPRRGGDARDGLRRRRVRAEPADGLIFFVEPSRPLAATILADIGGARRSPPMRHTIFAIASVLLLLGGDVPLARRLGRQAADEEVRGARMSAAVTQPRRPAPTPARRRSARDSSASWRLTDRLGLAFAWFLGVLFLS